MLYKTLFILSLVAVFAVMLFSSSSTGGLALPFSPITPQFTNPFDRPTTLLSTYSGIVDSPIEWADGIGNFIGFGAVPSFVGCDINGTLNETSRANCLNSRDGTVSYMRSGTSLNNYTAMLFNWTNRDIMLITGSQIRTITITMDCWSDLTDPNVPRIVFNLAGQSSAVLFCPKSLYATEVVWQIQASGWNTPEIIYTSKGQFMAALGIFGNDHTVFNDGTYVSYTSFSYIRIDIQVDTSGGTNTGCQAPQGAWFPWIDETACAILQFGTVIWNGLLFVFNGLIYIGGWLVFIGQNIANYLSVLAWLFAIPGLPVIIQTFVDSILLIWLLVIGVEMYKKISPFSA